MLPFARNDIQASPSSHHFAHVFVCAQSQAEEEAKKRAEEAAVLRAYAAVAAHHTLLTFLFFFACLFAFFCNLRPRRRPRSVQRRQQRCVQHWRQARSLSQQQQRQHCVGCSVRQAGTRQLALAPLQRSPRLQQAAWLRSLQ
jgi:hypothetical protein